MSRRSGMALVAAVVVLTVVAMLTVAAVLVPRWAAERKIRERGAAARKTTRDTGNPFFRALQILTHLREDSGRPAEPEA